jgi:hypothetical protein
MSITGTGPSFIVRVSTFALPRLVGDRARLVPALIAPTMACPRGRYRFPGDTIVNVWPINQYGRVVRSA